MEHKSAKTRHPSASSKPHDLIASAKGVLEDSNSGGTSGSGGGNAKAETGVGSVKEICLQLGFGSSGFLKQKEFMKVCKHVGLHSLKKKEQMKLFKRLDTNKDGLISIAQLQSELHTHMGASVYPSSPVPPPQTLKLHQSQKSQPLSLSQSKGEKLSTLMNTSYQVNDCGTSLFSSVAHSQDGSARSEDVLDLWDRLGIANGSDIFLSLGFNPQGRVNLLDLTAALNEVLTDQSSTDPISFAALLGYRHELKHLRSALEEVDGENKKLHLDLAQANARNSLLEIDIDETHPKRDPHWESKLLDALGNIKDTYWTVDAKYQVQIRDFKSQLENERQNKAAELSRLLVILEDIEKKANQERQQLLVMLANSQKEIEQQDQALAESKKKMLLLSKQNENLKKDLQSKVLIFLANDFLNVNDEEGEDQLILVEARRAEWIRAFLSRNPIDNNLLELDLEKEQLQLVECAEGHKQAILKQQHILTQTRAENKRLKDENDELVTRLEQTQQALYLAQRKLGLRNTRLPASFTTAAVIHHDGSVLDTRPASLSTELSQSGIEGVVESKLAKIEQAYQQAVSALETRQLAEKMTMLENFDQEKKCLIREQKNIEEILLAEQDRNLQTAFAKEKFDLVQKHENEKNSMNHQYQQEIAILQQRLLQTQSHTEDNINVRQLVQQLETQVAKCQEDMHHLKNQQKTDSEAQLLHQEMALRRELAEERNKLEEQYKSQVINGEAKLNNLFERGVEGLTGKLRDDFYALLREHSEREVSQSQAVLLNQLLKDRKDMTTAVEEEKCQIYEKADNERKALVAKYEKQIAVLKTELNETKSQLEAEKRMVSEMSLKYAKESIASENALETLRKTMERELLTELARITDSFESEKRELDDHKIKLEEKLTEMDKLLSRERLKTSDIDSLKETVRILMTEKKEMQTKAEEMKEKLFHNYQQMSVEREDMEVRLKAVRGEAESQGRMEGLVQGRKEGMAQGRKQAYEEGYRKGLSEGREEGYNQGKKDMDTSMSKSLEVMKTLVESLKREKAVVENELKQEVEKNDRCLQQLQGMEQLKRSCDLLQKEKNTLEEQFTAMAEKHNTEKEQLIGELDQQKAHILNIQVDKKATDSQAGSIHDGNKSISELMTTEQDITPTKEYGTTLSEDSGNLKEQMAQLCGQLQDTFKVHHELELLKKDYDLLLKNKSQLGETIHMLKSKAHENNNDNATAHLCAQINERNLILKDLYLQNSDLMKTLADSEDKRKRLEQQKGEMSEKLSAYRKTLDTVYESLSR